MSEGLFQESTVNVVIPARWVDYETHSIYVNQLVIGHAGHKEFYLTFGELILPPNFGLPGEPMPDQLFIEARVKIAIAPAVMVEFAQTIMTNVQNYLAEVQAQNAPIPPSES